MKKIVALVAVLATSIVLMACGKTSGTAEFGTNSDESGIHSVATNGASGTTMNQIEIGEGFGLCVNHIVEKGSFHVKATDAAGNVILDKTIVDNVADLVPAAGRIDVEISAQNATGAVDVIPYDRQAQAQANAALDEALAKEGVTRESVGLANPWSDARTADEAARNAGVGNLQLPADGTQLDGSSLSWSTYRHMEHVAEAIGTIGTTEIDVRKGLANDGADVSGDYNTYAKEWELESGGKTARCFGDEDGKASKVVWTSDGFCYSITTRDQSDPTAHSTLSRDAVATIVSQTK